LVVDDGEDPASALLGLTLILELALETGASSASEALAAGVEEGVATKLPPIVDLLELLGAAVLVEVRVTVVRD
jgi:hypothetical protein